MKMFLFGIIVLFGSDYSSGFLIDLHWDGHKNPTTAVRHPITTVAPGPAHTHQECLNMAEYKVVEDITKNHPCMSETQIWASLNILELKSPYCLNLATAHNNAYVKQHPVHCSCPGKFRQKQAHHISGHQDHLNCLQSQDCKALAERYYVLSLIGWDHKRQCEPHAYVWPLLAKVGVVGGYDTRSELILHLGNDFSNECTCTKVEPITIKATTKMPTTTTKPTHPPTTTKMTHPPTTTTYPTTSKTTHPPTTTIATQPPTTTKTTQQPTTTDPAVQLLGQMTCRVISTITDLGNHHVVANTQAAPCPNGNKTSPEAFVLDHCNADSPSLWKQGPNVMKYCSRIPLYTPVATFVNGKYAAVGGLTGIFVGCSGDGFKLGVQRCDSVPDIEHIDRGGVFTLDPDLYYIIG